MTKSNIQNTKAYEKKYKTGYGVLYPESHVIRVYHTTLDYQLHMTGGKILDFGCGNGTHLKYFQSKGFIPYGCDISKVAIKRRKNLIPRYAKNFHVIPNVPDLKKYFPSDFDLIFSNQALYYLNDKDIKNIIGQLYKMLRPGGVIFATMMPPSNYYYKLVTGESDGLSRVELKRQA